MQSDSEKYIHDLIAEGEHQQQDFKFEITSSRKIAKTLVAFANTDGGRLLIGVKDNGRIKGIQSDEEFYMIESASNMYCKPEVPFITSTHKIDGKMVLEVIVEPSKERPHYALDDNNRWMAYHRVKDQNFLADYILLQVWKRKRRDRGTFIQYTENEELVLQTLRGLEFAGLDQLKGLTGLSRRTLQVILVNLVALEAIEMHHKDETVLFLIAE